MDLLFDPDERVPQLGLDFDQAVRATRTTRNRLSKAIKDGELTARDTGKGLIFEPRELERWLQSLPYRGRRPNSPDIASVPASGHHCRKNNAQVEARASS